VKESCVDYIIQTDRSLLDEQLKRADTLDTKATVFLGLAGVMFGVVATGWTQRHPWGHPWTTLIALALMLAVIVCVVLALMPRTYQNPPDAKGLYENCTKNDLQDVKAQLAKDMTDAISGNDRVLAAKVRLVTAAYVLMLATVISISVPAMAFLTE